jgi:hypothetical protein
MLTDTQKAALAQHAPNTWVSKQPEDWAAILEVPVADLTGNFKKRVQSFLSGLADGRSAKYLNLPSKGFTTRKALSLAEKVKERKKKRKQEHLRHYEPQKKLRKDIRKKRRILP